MSDMEIYDRNKYVFNVYINIFIDIEKQISNFNIILINYN